MRPLYCLLGALALLLASSLATAATITVTTLDDELNSDGDCSLREAIASANTNASVDACEAGASGQDDIVLASTLPASARQIVLNQSAMEVTEDLVFNGAMVDGMVILNGADTYQLFRVTAGRFSLQNAWLQNARAERGGAVYVASGASFAGDAVTMDSNTATGDAATDGGAAIYNDGGTVTLSRSELSRNTAAGTSGSGGAILNNAGTLTITGSVLWGNSAQRAGGAIEAAGVSQTTLTDTSLRGNDAGPNPGNGGAFHISATGSATITGGEVKSNVAAREGGGFWNNTGAMSITGTLFRENDAQGPAADDGGGALFNNGGSMVVDNIAVQNNMASGASGSGGGIMSVGGVLTVLNSAIWSNQANRAGAGIESAGAMTMVSSSDIQRNIIPAASAAPGNGGGIHAGGGTLTIRGTTLVGNEATEGGGVWANGTLVIESSGSGTATLIRGNTGRGPAADNGGGGVYVETGGTATITDARILNNVASGASGSGGGILVASGASATLMGGEVSGNQANRAGAGVEIARGSLLLVRTMVTDNVIPEASAAPGNGGGLHSGGGAVTVRGGTFRRNVATEGGGLWSNASLIVESAGSDAPSVVVDNTGRGPAADNGGGGIYMETGGEATITNARIQGNVASGASGSGGGLFVASGASATVTGGKINANRANRAGAGIENAGGTLRLVNVEAWENVIPQASAAPGNGGALHSGGGSVSILGGAFWSNAATEGGALWSNGRLTIGDPDSTGVRTVIRNNEGRGDDATNGGGGVYAETGGDLRIYHALIRDNVASGASGSGGGLFVADESIVVVEGGSITGNRANRAGGGIEVADDGVSSRKTALLLTHVTVSGNRIATPAPGNGGGIHIGGSGVTTIRSSTLSGNTAREGAGVWVSGAGTLDIALSTVSGNAATEDGGGLYDNGGMSTATITLQDVTVTRNTAGASGGGLLSESTDGTNYTFANSIIGANTAASGADCFGVFVSGDYNLIHSTDGCMVNGDTANNVTGLDPMLRDLGDNGGATWTHLPMDGSPVLDAGQSAFELDQRDFLRNRFQSDIGSVERGGVVVPNEESPEAIDTEFALLPTRPNPARNQATIAYTLKSAAPVRIELFNVLGQRVLTVFEGAGTPGQILTAPLDAARLAPGIYVVRLQSEDQQATQRMTVVR